MTDDELISRLKEVARLISYYNAAEGEWARETEARERARHEYSELMSEASKRGLDTTKVLTGFLL